MNIWVDAQISPRTARFISDRLGLRAFHVVEMKMEEWEDHQIFLGARAEEACILTKDADFVELVKRLGPPPCIVWLRCGNTSSASLETLLSTQLSLAIDLIKQGESLVEILAGS